MRFEVLGPLQVCGPKGSFSPSAPKMEVLLTALLIRAGRLMSKEQLTVELWGESPPRRAAASLHVYVSQLRKFLNSAAGTQEGAAAAGCELVTRAPGYLLHIGERGLDLHDFQEAAQRGRRQLRSGRHEAAVTSFEAALSLYRGPLIEGLGEGPAVTGMATWVEQERLECLELMVEACIALGRHREMVNLLTSLTSRHPLRETFYRQLMLVLYRSERRAEALQVYRSARAVLRADLGLEPAQQLRDLHQAILSSDQALDVPTAV
ncbi:AfsR/SARP family transcriptional regulator [Streptomyces sp. NBC_01198]|uniref:AfsR/SARP family transcriptional regulator n=1 Tax=Streptomyces sp. NBC_01198 TaxID=2903769 RepID=UPI002E13AC36|nr:AfsR/SARP family transcriptional regulator [Streptomyces sp. NBC_01198]